MSIIIFEGMDGAGKSTLIQQLHNQLGYPIFQSGGPKTVEQMQTKLNELENLAFEDTFYLCDRVPFVSELIYSAAFGRLPIMPMDHLMAYWDLPMKIVYCHTDPTTSLVNMVRTFKAHKPIEHLKMVEENYSKIKFWYEHYFELLYAKNIDIFEYDWVNFDQHKQLTNWIME